MKTSNSKTKAKAFLGAAALITAAVFTLALLFTGCNHDIASDTVSITFSVDGANGTLKAKADGIDETGTSPISVKKGKIVTFTAKADKDYRVKKWTLNDDPITEAGKNTAYKLTVSKAAIVKVSFEPIPPGEAQLMLGPIKRDIKVKAVTFDGSDVQVSYCDEGTLKNNEETVLNATSTTITLTGKITELYCSGNELTQLDVRDLAALQTLDCSKNQLTELNVQGCSALKKLNCIDNKLNTQAMTKLLNALPNREASDGAKATLYTEKIEENCKDFTQPAELKTAFEGARDRHWKLQKEKLDGAEVDI